MIVSTPSGYEWKYNSKTGIYDPVNEAAIKIREEQNKVYPEMPTHEIVEIQKTFQLTTQKKKVNDEKHMISIEGIIPSGISNHIDKVVKKVKNVFHKNPPIAITLTKRTETENRNLWDTYSQYGPDAVLIGIALIYLLTRKE